MSDVVSAKITPIRTKPWDYETKNEYEEVTLRQQPYLHGHYRPIYDPREYDVYDPRYTRMKSSNWEAYRDPEKLWYTPYITNRRKFVEEAAHSFQFAKQAGMFSRLRSQWVAFLKDFYLPMRHVEYGASLQLQHVIRYAMGTPIEQSATFEASDKLGRAQLMTQWAMDMEECVGEMIAPAKETWLNHHGFSALREYMEQVLITNDWMEVLCAVNLCLDPLLMRIIYERLTALAIEEGDSSLSMFHFSCMKQIEWEQKWTVQLFSIMTKDQAKSRWDYLKALGYEDWKGDYRWGYTLSDPRLTPEEPLSNLEILQEWIGKWYPLARQAVLQLEQVVSPHDVTFSVEKAVLELEDQVVNPLFQKVGVNGLFVQGGVFL